ncbi:phage tail fiber protein [Mesorhizobium sp.]|uniref:phage tail fiber domain-containing protein n=1 Tax=Mesorhizobium sp. TaxID=1871066 RepID=UPI000FE8FFCB|nr:phage tail fiber protein [Mesorhizobium sp.]RWO57061.1 MAG: hypothetical protein EOS14_24630 [Mesorhizobium sp.]
MAYSPNLTTGNGSLTDFAVTFPYLRQAHVYAKVNGVIVSKTWVNSGMVRVSPAPAFGVSVEIYRDTPAVPLATLQDNKPIPAATYNDLVKQALYFAEEQAYLTAKGTADDRVATAADRVQTGLDRAATAADRVQTGLDKAATAADRVQTGLDRDAAAASAAAAEAAAGSTTPVAQQTHAATSKATPVDADEIPMADSAASFGIKKLTWANLKAGVLAYFNGSNKVTPVDADRVWVGDSTSSNTPKYTTLTQLKAFLKTYWDTLYAPISHTHPFSTITDKPTTLAGYGITDATKGAPDAVLEDQKPSGTTGGSGVATTWTTRDLNTKVRDPSGICTLASNQFTMTVAGWVEWTTPSYAIGMLSRLWNVTDGVLVAMGAASRADSSPNSGDQSIGGGPIVAGKTYAIQYYLTGTGSNRLGLQGGQGIELYTRVKFWRT